MKQHLLEGRPSRAQIIAIYSCMRKQNFTTPRFSIKTAYSSIQFLGKIQYSTGQFFAEKYFLLKLNLNQIHFFQNHILTLLREINLLRCPTVKVNLFLESQLSTTVASILSMALSQQGLASLTQIHGTRKNRNTLA